MPTKKVLAREMVQVANNVYRDARGAMYQTHIGQRYRQVIGDDGMEHTEGYLVSEGLRRISPRKHLVKVREALKADGTKKRLKKWARAL